MHGANKRRSQAGLGGHGPLSCPRPTLAVGTMSPPGGCPAPLACHPAGKRPRLATRGSYYSLNTLYKSRKRTLVIVVRICTFAAMILVARVGLLS